MRRWILAAVVTTVLVLGLVLWDNSRPPSAYEQCRSSLSSLPSGAVYVDDPCGSNESFGVDLYENYWSSLHADDTPWTAYVY